MLPVYMSGGKNVTLGVGMRVGLLYGCGGESHCCLAPSAQVTGILWVQVYSL